MLPPQLFRFLFIVFLMATSAQAWAHKGSIRGTMYDNSHKPLEGANIFIVGTNAAALSDALGKFFVRDIQPGKYSIILGMIGYQPVSDSVTIEDGITTDVTYTLAPSPIQMQSAYVNGQKDIATTSAKEMQLHPVNNAGDMLRLVPGLFTAQHQGGGKAEQVFLRGFDCDHGTDVNISIDNMPVNMVSHAHGQGFADTHFIIPEAVQRIEYGKGPYQADKGDFCTAGYVAYKTRNALDSSFVKTEAGSFGYLRTVVGLNLLNRHEGTGNDEAYIISEYNKNTGYFALPENFSRFNLMGKYTKHISSDKLFSLTLSGFNSSWDASGQLPARAVKEGITSRYGSLDPEGGATSRYNMNLQYMQNTADNSYIKTNVYLTYYTFRLYSDFSYFLVDSINGDQIRQAERRALGGYNSEYNKRYSVAGCAVKSRLGAGLRYDDVMNDELSHTLDKSVTLNEIQLGDVHETSLYGYLDNSISITKKLSVKLGTRYDYFIQQYVNKLPADNIPVQSKAGLFSPKAGVSYCLNDNILISYSYGTGFHTNDTRTLLPAVTADKTIPGAFAHDLSVTAHTGDKLALSVAVWRLDLQQEYTYNGDIAIIDTAGKTRRYGGDFSVKYCLLPRVHIDVDINYADAREVNRPEGSNYIPLVPSFTSTGGITYDISKAFSGALRYRHMSDRPLTENNSIVASGYTIFDAIVDYHSSRYDASIQVQNLLNTQWDEAQFATETRLRYANGLLEPAPKTDVCFTPGTPLFLKLSVAYKF